MFWSGVLLGWLWPWSCRMPTLALFTLLRLGFQTVAVESRNDAFACFSWNVLMVLIFLTSQSSRRLNGIHYVKIPFYIALRCSTLNGVAVPKHNTTGNATQQGTIRCVALRCVTGCWKAGFSSVASLSHWASTFACSMFAVMQRASRGFVSDSWYL